jgi:ATP-dependent DNA ligase
LSRLLAELPTRCRIIHGERLRAAKNGIASFDLIRHRRHDAKVFLYVFDLIELEWRGRAAWVFAVRKATLASVLV